MSRDFLVGFFHELVSPKPLMIPLGPFQIFCENSQRYSQLKVCHRPQGVPPVSLTPVANGKNLQSENCFMISFPHFWVVDLAYTVDKKILKFILSCQQFVCSHCLPPVSFTPVANLPPVSLIPLAICHRHR